MISSPDCTRLASFFGTLISVVSDVKEVIQHAVSTVRRGYRCTLGPLVSLVSDDIVS